MISIIDKEEQTGMATMAGRRHKVALAPGHSHMDWMRLMSSPGMKNTFLLVEC